MIMREFRGEPWGVKDGYLICDAEGDEVLHGMDLACLQEDESDMLRRIAACVNRCNGISTEALEDLDDDLEHNFREALDRLRDWKEGKKA